jgi:hypothetical protein
MILWPVIGITECGDARTADQLLRALLAAEQTAEPFYSGAKQCQSPVLPGEDARRSTYIC